MRSPGRKKSRRNSCQQQQRVGRKQQDSGAEEDHAAVVASASETVASPLHRLPRRKAAAVAVAKLKSSRKLEEEHETAEGRHTGSEEEEEEQEEEEEEEEYEEGDSSESKQQQQQQRKKKEKKQQRRQRKAKHRQDRDGATVDRGAEFTSGLVASMSDGSGDTGSSCSGRRGRGAQEAPGTATLEGVWAALGAAYFQDPLVVQVRYDWLFVLRFVEETSTFHVPPGNVKLLLLLLSDQGASGVPIQVVLRTRKDIH